MQLLLKIDLPFHLSYIQLFGETLTWNPSGEIKAYARMAEYVLTSNLLELLSYVHLFTPPARCTLHCHSGALLCHIQM